MPTIAELAAAQPGTPIVGLQGYISKVYETKVFGKGHMQACFLSDNTGEMLLRVMDGPELAAGMQVQISAKPKEITVRGQKTTEWDGAYTEVYEGKMRFNCKARCLMILSGGAPAQAAAQYQPSAAYNPTQGGVPGYPPAPALAPGGPLGFAYGQAQATPLPGTHEPRAGQPGAFPAQPGRRPDPEWGAGAGLADQAATAWRTGADPFAEPAPPPPAPAWQPKPKKTVAEARQFLLDQFAELAEAVGREWAGGAPAIPLPQLPPEVVAGIMSWVTHISIGVERGDVVADSPPAAPSGGGQAGGAEALPAEAGDDSIPF